MKTLAILGGMSHQSTAIYYHQINDRVHKALGANHSARLLVLSVDFETIAHLQRPCGCQYCRVAAPSQYLDATL